jgi:Xaa-Pro aminopeptidase
MAPSATLADRYERLRRVLAEQALDALIVTTPSNIRYLTNHAGSAGVLLATPEGPFLLVDGRYTESVRMRQASAEACPLLRVVDVPNSYDRAMTDWLVARGLDAVGFEAAHVSVAKHAWWVQTLAAARPALALRATEGLIEGQRVVKDAFEIDALTRSARGLTRVAQQVVSTMRSGMTERAVAAIIEAELRAAGYERPSFEPIVASGPNAALPHYRAGDRVIGTGDMVVLDFGGVLDGYCSDLTRTVAVGEPSSEFHRVYGAVLDAQQAAIHAVRAGVGTSEVDKAARDVLSENGLGEAFTHGTGHGLGLDIHEDPRVTRADAHLSTPLQAGMVVTVEPGAYLPGWGGVRIEDDVLVTPLGCELLTRVPRHMLMVD